MLPFPLPLSMLLVKIDQSFVTNNAIVNKFYSRSNHAISFTFEYASHHISQNKG
jgi:hypothetical protein